MRLYVLGADAAGGAVVELAAEHGYVVATLASSDSVAVDADDIDADTVLSREREDSVVGDADPESVLDAGYDVLVGATPTILGDAEPGFSHVERVPVDDYHVVLADKGPVAKRYADVRALEADSEETVHFDITVDGAFPISPTVEGVGPSHMSVAYGALNGTVSFVLPRMAAEGSNYEHVLTEVRDLDVAEADPASDVDDTDTALEGIIVANVLAEGETEFTFDSVEVEGIQEFSEGVPDLAQEDGQTI